MPDLLIFLFNVKVVIYRVYLGAMDYVDGCSHCHPVNGKGADPVKPFGTMPKAFTVSIGLPLDLPQPLFTTCLSMSSNHHYCFDR